MVTLNFNFSTILVLRWSYRVKLLSFHQIYFSMERHERNSINAPPQGEVAFVLSWNQSDELTLTWASAVTGIWTQFLTIASPELFQSSTAELSHFLSSSNKPYHLRA